MYMDIRIPTPINSNPGMVLPPRNFHTVNDVARFAAQVINGIMEHKEIIDRLVYMSNIRIRSQYAEYLEKYAYINKSLSC